MAPDICSKLVNKLNNLDRLHHGPYNIAAIPAHHDFSGAAKRSPNRNRSGTKAIPLAGFDRHLIF